MSDYMFMLESHLSTEQSRAVAEIQAAAAESATNLFLAGGAMRDMLGGFPIRDLDFVVEGDAPKIAKVVAQKSGARLIAVDEVRRVVELQFPGGVNAELGMARREKYGKPGAKPQVTPATIYEDLRGRDFTINAIALSLNRASRGLLLDPTNGLGDLERRELRAVSNYSLYDDPIRLLRLLRFRVRLGFTLEERTAQSYANAREAEVEKHIQPKALLHELRQIANEVNSADLLRVLDEEKLLSLYSPALTGAKLNLAGLQKLQKARSFIPFNIPFPADNLALFLAVVTEKLTPKERAQLVSATGMGAAEVSAWQKLEARAKKLEKALTSAKLTKPSHVYEAVTAAPGEEVLYVLMKSSQRLAQDRIKNFFQKYLPLANEVTDKDVAAKGAAPGTPKFAKVRREVIAQRLDGRPKKVAPPPEPPPAPVAATAARGVRR
ncbi:MAG: hypothetical protein SFV54_03260 [Bryobacteraceae bacterium]|nr:hypothetical protein [Bryobacteraceae bacterium]